MLHKQGQMYTTEPQVRRLLLNLKTCLKGPDVVALAFAGGFL
jgi:hypothetical protein